ncbi:LolA family protein [Rhizosaccharibacter radicis]|uniref:Outer membrane lipoprotein carrier protein LolA n=1 Tax=Rhizosaccharibacter radicis TaxID=2782605 RepID=A0ABT1VTE8_9PROT|nr:outer membrane lipoprotein carrier protein LolA [Acetobacteraceae bacterium KSS12]
MRAASIALFAALLMSPAAALAQSSTPGTPVGGPPATLQGAGTGAAAAALTPADRGWVQRVQDTLNGITTLKARFQQIAPDGRRTSGTAWLDRPGRMRFAYDKPSPLLLVAGEGKLVFNDSELKQTTEIPLDKTPLGLLLRPNLSLSGDVTVTGFRHDNGLVQVTVVRTATPGDGSLTLIMSEQPLGLRSWRVVDAQGRETVVDLFDIQLGGALPQNLFDVHIGEQ